MSTPVTRGVVDVAEINPYAPRPHAFTEAALCLRDAIRAAGYASEVYANKADLNGTNIVLGALPPHLPGVDQLDPGRTVIYNFEQLGTASYGSGSPYIPWLRRWPVADYHSRNIEWLRAFGGRSAPLIELPVVPSASIAFRPDLAMSPTVDVLFFGTSNPRREDIFRRLRAAGITVEVVAGAFADELTPAIKRARIVLHVHFYETALFPTARFLQPVVQGVPVVCESSVFSALGDWSGSGIVFAPYDGLVRACQALLAAPDECADRARRNQTFAAGIDFATPFESLLKALDRFPKRIPPVPQILRPPAPPAIEPAAQDAKAPLSTEEIEAILAGEAEQLPPESHVSAAPLKLAERQPGKGPYGVLIVVLLLVFSFYTIWLATAAR